MKRIVWIALVAVLLAGLGAYLYFKDRRYELVITQAQIDAALAENFPVTKPFLIFFDITYAHPSVTLLPADQRVRVSLDAELNVKILGQPRKLSGRAQLTGRVNYRQETQEFFLDDPHFDQLSIEGIPPEYLEPVNGAASRVAQEYVQRFPIYRIRATDTRMAITKLLLKNVQIRNREVAVSMGL